MPAVAKRVAALYDIHGNLPALEAVLGEARVAGVDRIAVGGDVFPGPMATECLDVLLAQDIPVHFIYGNGEVAVLVQCDGGVPAVPPPVREVIGWNADRLSNAQAGALRAWPMTCRLE